jgi:YbbR domain-containing protein
VLAIIGWAYFRYASNPVLAARYEQQLSVPIVAQNLPAGSVARYTEKEAIVIVNGRRGVPAVKPGEIKAVLNLAGKDPGVYNVPVELVAPDVAVQSLSPASISLSIEKIDERPFPLSLHYVGPQETQMAVKAASASPTQVLVRGPSDALSEVSAVRVDVTVPAQAQSFDEMLRPTAVDSSGQEVTGLDVSPESIRVHVDFVQGATQQK